MLATKKRGRAHWDSGVLGLMLRITHKEQKKEKPKADT